MIPSGLIALILPKILSAIMKQFDLVKISKYVFEKNELDLEVKSVNRRLKNIVRRVGDIEKVAHEPQDYKERCEQMEKRLEKLEHGFRKEKS